ncbi:MAG TPA: potassium channel family protein [Capsulimonadaceae bacterium]|nr:potassium channel family protein [Capsulimonadaceae bacterium]
MMAAILGVIVGVALICGILWDCFETIVLPRSVNRKFRFARFFYTNAWRFWSALSRLFQRESAQDGFLSNFGPLSLILLLNVWAACMIFGFALIHWSLGSPFNAPEKHLGFGSYIYVSGTTFFTLGLGDVTPLSTCARVLTVLEAAVGFGFLAVVIGYLPVIYQAFSRREVGISLLDSRASSPPSASELLRRHAESGRIDSLIQILTDLERWAGDLLESHLSYPVLAFYRSQHDRESWLAALTTVLDACALIEIAEDRTAAWQAGLTFAMARHAAIDLALIFQIRPATHTLSRLPPPDLARIRETLADAGFPLREDEEAGAKLIEMRRGYEPYVIALAQRFLLVLPRWIAMGETMDNWETSAWDRQHFLGH